jgi:von Willebrand factor type A domain-containing protein/Regulator of Chromosome Condensation (RCC1) repeat protein/Ig-like domain-containing protein/putative Ig domain-containing protein
MSTALNPLYKRLVFDAKKPGFPSANFLCAIILTLHVATLTGHAAGMVVAWGDNNNSQTNVPSNVTNAVAVAGGTAHSLALKNTGAIAGWGDNTYGEASSPAGLSNTVAIAAGDGFSVALQSNGTVVVWGSQSAVPAGLTNAVAIAASLDNALALTEDGKVISWLTGPPPPSNATNMVAIAAGNTHSLALKGDGTVIAWGDSSLGKTAVPPGLTNVVALAAGEYHSMALKGDGTVIAWGDNTWGQSTVPAGLSNVVAIAAGAFHSLALKQNGTVSVWGDDTYLQTNVPVGLSNVVGIAAGRYHNLAFVGNGSPVITVQPVSQYNAVTGNAFFWVMVAGLSPLSYQWQVNGTNIAGATNSLLTLTNLSIAGAGVYSVTVSNSLGTVTSGNVELPPVWRLPFFLVQPQSQTVLCNGSTTFQAVADGTKPLSYQWQFNGTNISGATNSVLTLTNITDDGAGQYTIIVTNVNGLTTSQAAVLTVTGQPPLITSPVAAGGKQGKNFSYTITGLLNPILFSANGLPAGLNVNTTNGLIQGTPSVSGLFDVTLGTANLCASAQTNLVLSITSSVPIITSALTASGTEQGVFNYHILATDAPTGFGAENLPQGLNVNPATGIISGSPLYAGTYDATISASNIWGVGTADLHLTISNALITGLSIANVTTNYSSPYLLDFQFSLRNNNDPTQGDAVIANPNLFSVTAFEDGQPVSPSETSVLIQPASGKVLKAYLVLDFTESIASLANGDTNNNGISDAIDTEVTAAQEFVNEQPANAQIGVYEFHRDDEAPQQVQSLTTDKTLLDNSIAGIWTNYVQNFPAGSRCWDALVAAINALGPTNSDEEHYVIFCSDGSDTSSTNTVQNVISAANNANVQIYCVGFGDNIDTATLQSITSQTQGRYYAANSVSALAVEFAQIGKDLSGQYILRWATLNRTANAFMPSFQITYQGITADSPANPPPVITGTNDVVSTNNSGSLITNEVPVYMTNYIISPYLPTAYAGNVTVGSLRLVSDAEIHPTGIDLRATYVPRYIRQIRLHYQANWPCAVSLESTNVGEMLYGWSLIQTNDGVGGQWALLSSPNPQSLATSIPFASFGPLLTFTFRDVLNASNAFSVFAVDNTLYTNTGNQSFVFENTNQFITVYPVLPHGTPVPWLIEYGFTNNFAAVETSDPDGNGMLIWQDYVAGLNPTNASSVFTVQNFSPTGQPGHYQITFSTALNRTYRVDTSSDLLTWQTLQDGIAGTGGNVTVTDSRNLSGATQTFYRVAVYVY